MALDAGRRARDEHEQRERDTRGEQRQRHRDAGVLERRGQRAEQQRARDGGDAGGRVGERARSRAREFGGQRFFVHGPPISLSIRRLSRCWTSRRSRHSRSIRFASLRDSPVVAGRSST